MKKDSGSLVLVLCGTAGIFLEMVRKSKNCRVQKTSAILASLICFSKFPMIHIQFKLLGLRNTVGGKSMSVVWFELFAFIHGWGGRDHGWTDGSCYTVGVDDESHLTVTPV